MTEKEELVGKIVVGQFICREAPTLSETLYEITREVAKVAKEN